MVHPTRLVCTLLAASLAIPASASPKAPWVKGPGKRPVTRREAAINQSRRDQPWNETDSCGTGVSNYTVKAPKKNIWLGLTEAEVAGITEFVHNQKSLNLTAVENATNWDNSLLLVELMLPNKTDALNYFDGGGAEPARHAHIEVDHRASVHNPAYLDYIVGPLPISNKTTVEPLAWPYTKGPGSSHNYAADDDARNDFMNNFGAELADITRALWNGTAMGLDNDTMSIWGIDPLFQEDGRTISWDTFWNNNNDVYDDSTLLPLGLFLKPDITGRDPSQWSNQGVLYNGEFYDTIDDFKSAFYSGNIQTFGPNEDEEWGRTDQRGPVNPTDWQSPPMLIQPAGQRFQVDVEQQYVQWMDFEFYIAFTRDTGIKLFDINFKGQRIIYEIGLQEALAHYGANDPVQSGTAYLDSYYGFGPYAFELVNGYDCPSYAFYLNSTFYADETTRTHLNNICLFEQDAGHPIQRHSSSQYVTITRNIFFTVRTVSTVGNYDYMLDYTFYMDGSLHVTVRASGYIQSAYFANNEEYGFHIHEYLSGSMHDHVLNFKVDLDILGEKNSLQNVSFVPATVEYPWSNGKTRNTMKLEKSFVTTETGIDYPYNSAALFAVVNKDKPNKYGELPGFRVLPSTAPVHLTVNAAHWAERNFWVTKQKDTEPRSSHPFNNQDVADLVVNFSKFVDDESIEQEDLVLWINAGMHHVPHTGDLPNTVFSTAWGSRINYHNGNVTEVATFGSETIQPECTVDLRDSFTDLWDYTGDVVVRKFPYDPNDPFFNTQSIVKRDEDL
ncbi:copper amine oxidase [Dacryopinax primogenitus]|uniref:Amine oxidase n=1 Tax=Dacryopinax primogenitus (strain DJM 731) TaxID=1858805 RepID=M5FQJ2_DACPD|nr:copper amine oxidase [Dacryopinax primogenitus]EJT99165.1 copper amine oxidase [Dacryopinax primogenitus]